MNDRLQTALEQLRLSGPGPIAGRPAAGSGRPSAEPRRVPGTDPAGRTAGPQRAADRTAASKAAAFRELKTLDDFDWSFNPSIKKKQIYDLATCRFIREARDVLLLGPPGVGQVASWSRRSGYQAIKAGFTVLYRSIFDVVRDFLHDEAFGGEEKVLARYLKPDLLIIDDMGMKQLPKRSGEYLFEIIMRRYETRSHDDDLEPAAGGLGQADRRRAGRHRDPRPLPAPRRDHHDHRQELPAAEPVHFAGGRPEWFKTRNCADRVRAQ